MLFLQYPRRTAEDTEVAQSKNSKGRTTAGWIELHSGYGYYAVWVFMIVVAFGMLGFFWRRGWIGSKERRVKEE